MPPWFRRRCYEYRCLSVDAANGESRAGLLRLPPIPSPRWSPGPAGGSGVLLRRPCWCVCGDPAVFARGGPERRFPGRRPVTGLPGSAGGPISPLWRGAGAFGGARARFSCFSAASGGPETGFSAPGAPGGPADPSGGVCAAPGAKCGVGGPLPLGPHGRARLRRDFRPVYKIACAREREREREVSALYTIAFFGSE